MSKVNKIEIQDFSLWEKKAAQPRALYSFDLELTARCNNNCSHCYINLPANDSAAKAQELTIAEIEGIADQAVELGAVWVLLTGGEPLLRRDFAEIYLMLKRKGLLVSVFTNATLVNPTHIELFKRYPPRDIEVTLYGASQASYEAVTRLPGSYAAFQHGLEMLFEAGVRIRLKAMALRSNLHEIDAMAAFGKQYTKDYYRFDPVLHLRFDGDPQRNAEIISERLTPEEVVALEARDAERFAAMEKDCDNLIIEDFAHIGCNHLFHCGAGNGSFSVGYNGTFRLCSSLWAPGTTVNLRQVSLREAWENLVPAVRDLRSDDPRFLETCRKCPYVNLCLWCPAHAHLETGAMDGETPYFCQVAHARAKSLGEKPVKKQEDKINRD
jgi:radical SAM protein with 4Fe4S-binding SPASM domain